MPRKASRRGHDEGTVYEYPEGSGKWYAQLPADENGKRPKRRAKSQKEAIFKLRELEQKRTQGQDIRSQYPLLSDELISWVDVTKKPKLAAKTWYSYKQIIRLYILPNLPRRLRVNEIRAKHIEDMRNKIAKKLKSCQETDADTTMLSARTVNLSLFVLKSAMKSFMKRYHLSRNEAELVDPLPGTKVSIKTLDKEQVYALIEAIDTHRLKLLYLLAFTFGFRIGELLGLRPCDVNIEEPCITISGTLQYVPGEGVTRKDRPKTASSVRTLPLSEELVTLYREHIHNMHAEYESRRETYREEGLVLQRRVSGTPASFDHKKRHGMLSSNRFATD